ncbi:STAS domain-containing protein [Kitasatospora sp. NPDC096147]|uniref:STAS domain-containing protein n=1 Tax=Kitasatospora sp. NPDC096147 TaxID=3364093 RepID=UPI0037F8E915
MPDYTLATSVHTHPSGAVVVVADGELDHHTAPRLIRTLTTLEPTAGLPLVLDLSGLSFCDSAGLSALVAAYRVAVNAGAPFALAGADRDLTRMLRITGVDGVFGLYPDVEQAVAARS